MKQKDGYRVFTLQDIKEQIIKTYTSRYMEDNLKRKLIIHASPCTYGKPGCIFMALDGSPPKGYALYVHDHSYLILVDAWGKTKRYGNTILENHDDILARISQPSMEY